MLVIDDLHELRSPDALRLLERFLARIPATLRVVLSTRADPELGLHRLRLTGDLVEIRGADLRFSLEETRGLLEADGIALEDATVAQLHERTEGWAAGLRLAAISLAAHPDRERFVSEFSGSERTVAAYLLAEVLERQPAEVRDLLLRTSIVDRVSGPLADFLTGATGSERILQELEDANAFVVVDRRRPDVVPLPPPVRRPAPAGAAPALPGEHQAAAPGAPPSGTRNTATSSRPSATRRRPATGRTRRAWSPTTTSASSSTAASRRSTRSSRPSRRHAADTDPELAARLRQGAALRRPPRGQRPPPVDGGAACCRASRPSAGSVSSSSTRRRRSRSRAVAATCATVLESMRSVETALSAQAASDPRARQRPAGRRAHEPRHRRALGVADGGRTRRTSSRRSSSRGASDGRTCSSGASGTSSSSLRSSSSPPPPPSRSSSRRRRSPANTDGRRTRSPRPASPRGP